MTLWWAKVFRPIPEELYDKGLHCLPFCFIFLRIFRNLHKIRTFMLGCLFYLNVFSRYSSLVVSISSLTCKRPWVWLVYGCYSGNSLRGPGLELWKGVICFLLPCDNYMYFQLSVKPLGQTKPNFIWSHLLSGVVGVSSHLWLHSLPVWNH